MMARDQVPAPRDLKLSRRQLQLRPARTCYGHLAGRLGVALAAFFRNEGYVILEGNQFEITKQGWQFFASIGVDISDVRARRRASICKPCMDWTEREFHIGGALGSAICGCFFERKWISRNDGSRAVTITPRGHEVLRKWRVE